MERCSWGWNRPGNGKKGSLCVFEILSADWDREIVLFNITKCWEVTMYWKYFHTCKRLCILDVTEMCPNTWSILHLLHCVVWFHVDFLADLSAQPHFTPSFCVCSHKMNRKEKEIMGKCKFKAIWHQNENWGTVGNYGLRLVRYAKKLLNLRQWELKLLIPTWKIVAQTLIY